MIVRSIHFGVSEASLRAATGFHLGDLSNPPPTPELSEEELHLLRDVVDPRRHVLPDIDQDSKEGSCEMCEFPYCGRRRGLCCGQGHELRHRSGLLIR